MQTKSVLKSTGVPRSGGQECTGKCSTDCGDCVAGSLTVSGGKQECCKCSTDCTCEVARGTRNIPVQEMRSKDEVLAYRFPALVERLQKDLGLSKQKAQELFRDTLMFLYLCGTNTSKYGLSPTKSIDEAWHTFIIFTREYAEFCKQNFGRFIHHAPFTNQTRKQAKENSRPATAKARKVFGILSTNWTVKNSDDNDCGSCMSCKECNSQ